MSADAQLRELADGSGRIEDVDDVLVRTVAAVGVRIGEGMDVLADLTEDVRRLTDSVERIEDALFDEAEP